MQVELFGAPVLRALPPIPGLEYVPDFCSIEEERALLESIDAQPWDTDWRRRRQQYGVGYEGKGDPQPGIPRFLHPLAQRICDAGYLESFPVNSVINEYLPGQGIAAHLDRRWFGPTVVAVSFGSAYLMDFHADADPDERYSVDVAPRSLLVLGGAARRHFRHGIAARKSDLVDGRRRPRGRRISVTFRTAGQT